MGAHPYLVGELTLDRGDTRITIKSASRCSRRTSRRYEDFILGRIITKGVSSRIPSTPCSSIYLAPSTDNNTGPLIASCLNVHRSDLHKAACLFPNGLDVGAASTICHQTRQPALSKEPRHCPCLKNSWNKCAKVALWLGICIGFNMNPHYAVVLVCQMSCSNIWMLVESR